MPKTNKDQASYLTKLDALQALHAPALDVTTREQKIAALYERSHDEVELHPNTATVACIMNLEGVGYTAGCLAEWIFFLRDRERIAIIAQWLGERDATPPTEGSPHGR